MGDSKRGNITVCRLIILCRHFRVASAIIAVAVLFGCGDKQEPPSPTPQPAAQPTQQALAQKAPTQPTAPAPQPLPQQITGMVYIPPGSFIAGTAPGAAPRCPHEEMTGVTVSLGGYYIDQYPHPTVGHPPTVGLTFEQARQTCASLQKRLCTELEWERACKGRDNSYFPYGNVFDPAICGAKQEGDAQPLLGSFPRCTTEEGVRDMNGYAWEWTDSRWGIPGPGQNDPVLRGGHKRYGKIANRCANRTHVPADKVSNRVGFRCCFGSRNSAEVTVSLTPSSTFEAARLPVDDWKILKTDPDNLPIIDDFREVRRIEQRTDPSAVFSGAVSDYQLSRLAGDSILWRPEANTNLYVMNATYSKHRKRANELGGSLLIFAEKDHTGVMRFIALFDRPDKGGEQPIFYTNPTAGGALDILLAWRDRRGPIALVTEAKYNCGGIKLKPKKWIALAGLHMPVPPEVPDLKPIYIPGAEL